MKRAAIATLVVALAGSAHADSRVAANEPQPPKDCTEDKERPCDEIADVDSREANLDIKAPRSGLTFGVAGGLGIFMGGDIGVGRGPGVSVRLGHVATRRAVITFEFVASGALHKRSVDGETLSDNNINLFAGAQRYASARTWVRLAGGFSFLQTNVVAKTGRGGDPTRIGVGGLLGAGIDLWRPGRGTFVIGIEAFIVGSVTGDGFKLQLLPFGVGLTLY